MVPLFCLNWYKPGDNFHLYIYILYGFGIAVSRLLLLLFPVFRSRSAIYTCFLEENSQLIIVNHCNCLFIRCWLERNVLEIAIFRYELDCFTKLHVVTELSTENRRVFRYESESGWFLDSIRRKTIFGQKFAFLNDSILCKERQCLVHVVLIQYYDFVCFGYLLN